MKIIKVFLASLFVFIIGCSANGPAFSPIATPDTNKAIVYIYRLSNFVGCGMVPDVYIDEVKYGPLKNNGYLVYSVEPSKKMIEVRHWGGDVLTIYPDLIAGQEYYIRLNFSLELNVIKMELGLIPKEYAIREIIYTKKSD
jgi:hypothetical protein